MDTETNPVEPEVEVVTEDEVPGSTEPEIEANPDEEAAITEPETVEVERDGKTYKVPAELKDDFLRHGDYTRKTQEVAERRKELDATIERVQQTSDAEVNARAQVVALEAAMQRYENVDWQTLQAQDPNGAMQHWMTFSQLQNALAGAKEQHKSALDARTLEAQQLADKRIEEGLAVLERDIPGWGPQKAEELMSFGAKQFGLTRQYMESVTDPMLVKLLHALKEGTKPKPAAPPVVPAAKVTGGRPPAKGLDDRMSMDDWLKQRNAQVRRA